MKRLRCKKAKGEIGRVESRFWGVFIIAVHRAFVLGLGAQHRGIVELSEDRDVCDSVRLLYLLTYLLTHRVK